MYQLNCISSIQNTEDHRHEAICPQSYICERPETVIKIKCALSTPQKYLKYQDIHIVSCCFGTKTVRAAECGINQIEGDWDLTLEIMYSKRPHLEMVWR